MPGQPDDNGTSSPTQPSNAASRRKWLQMTGVGITSGILAITGASAEEDNSPFSEGRSRGPVGASETEDANVGESTADESSTSEGVALGGGEGYDNIVEEDGSEYVVASKDELTGALTDASGGETVFIESDVTLDMSNTSLNVPDGVTVASDRGLDGSEGALLETSQGNEPSELFTMQAESRITGVRMRGPWADGPNGSSNSNAVTAAGSEVEIDNCEIGQFSYAGVNLNNSEAYVHHNYIHENNQSGLGYGITMGAGRPVIEYNYFDYNRHSIASTGSHEGYVCRYNHFGPNATGVVIDIHEPAGQHSEVRNNIVEAVDHIGGNNVPLPGVQVRGVPGEVYEVTDNWFFNPNEPLDSPAGSWTNEGIIQPTETAWRNVEFSDNYYGEDAATDYDEIIPEYDGSWT